MGVLERTWLNWATAKHRIVARCVVRFVEHEDAAFLALG
jgi:hypothetical protein